MAPLWHASIQMIACLWLTNLALDTATIYLRHGSATQMPGTEMASGSGSMAAKRHGRIGYRASPTIFAEVKIVQPSMALVAGGWTYLVGCDFRAYVKVLPP
jgi:hypothetical protein